MWRDSLEHGRGRTALLGGAGVVTELADAVAPWLADRRAFVVTTKPIESLHGERLAELLAGAGGRDVLRVPDGEEAKRAAVAADVCSRMSRLGARRDDRVVAFGGGSVGDLAGFVASIYLRGVELAQVPTTALAQVDAAVGGKTAVNLPEAKNAVGTFWHPAFVLSETSLLATQSPRARATGLVEAIKMAALLDPHALDAIEAAWEELLMGDSRAWADVVQTAQRTKVAVVEADAEEAGPRRVLNFGHTLGHALETAADAGALAHGEAVAYGMRFAYELANRIGTGGDETLARRVGNLLDRLELPPLPALEIEALEQLIGRDKKARRDGVHWVLPAGDGGWTAQPVEPVVVRELLTAFLAAGGRGC